MTFKPAHKDNTAGQIRNEITLGDYIANKSRHEAFNTVKEECCGNPLRGCKDCPPQRKLTFEEWYDKERPWARNLHQVHEARLIWNAAQENK